MGAGHPGQLGLLLGAQGTLSLSGSRWTEAEGQCTGAEALMAHELPTWVRYFDATRGRQWLLAHGTGIMNPGPVPSG